MTSSNGPLFQRVILKGIGVLLLLAGFAKLRTSHVLFGVYGASTVAGIAELGLAAFLLIGVAQRQTVWATIAVFFVFFQVALYRTLLGEASCGCFGEFDMNPIVMVFIDGVVIVLLIGFGSAHDVQ